MRILTALALLANPAAAWDFTPLPICTVAQSDQPVAVTMTFDPATALYALTLTKDTPWPNAPTFSIQFIGPQSLTISTGQHLLSNGNRTLSVSDRGFGNVINGLQFNTAAIAIIGGETHAFSLTGAAIPVEQFRNCGATLTG